MRQSYRDIIDRIDDKPHWFDENGVPRYADFHPSLLADIYSDEAALATVKCQACGTDYKVAISSSVVSDIERGRRSDHDGKSLQRAIANGSLHYGDPPDGGCCDAGSTMNSEMQRVHEYWHRNADTRHAWVRNSDFEIEVLSPFSSPAA